MHEHPEFDRKLLHGVTLERMLNELVEHVGWERMGRRVKIACFNIDPSISSSLKFLRRTPWARSKVEEMYLESKTRHLKQRSREADQRPFGGASEASPDDDNSDHALRVSDTPTE